MHILWRKLQRLKADLKTFSNNMTNLNQKVKLAMNELELAQDDMSHNRLNKDKIRKVKECT